MSGVPDHWSDSKGYVPVIGQDGEPIDGPGYIDQSIEEQGIGEPVGEIAEPGHKTTESESGTTGEWSEDLGRYGNAQRWELPGEGDHGAGCGEFYPAAVCETCGEPTFAARNCGRRTCPDCWGGWAQKAAVRATRRVQAFRHTQSGVWQQAAHGVVSPEEGEVMTEREFWAWRSRAAEIAESKGWRGFAVIPHPWRVTDEGKKRYKRADPEYGVWAWLRNDVEDWRELTYWSPHYHIIGVTSPDMDAAEEGDECVYRFIRSFDEYDGARGRGSHEDVYSAFRYLLSHTGYPAGSTKQVTTWYGSLANSVFVEDAAETWQYQKPSEGVLSVLTREIEAVAGESLEDDERAESDESDDEGECPVAECDGVLIDVFDVRRYLRHVDPPPEVQDVMLAALEWRLGERQPPPGLRRPTTEAEAREALEAVS
jgi:hypothetical protein